MEKKYSHLGFSEFIGQSEFFLRQMVKKGLKKIKNGFGLKKSVCWIIEYQKKELTKKNSTRIKSQEVSALELGKILNLTADRINKLSTDVEILKRLPNKKYPLVSSVNAYLDFKKADNKLRDKDKLVAEKLKLAKLDVEKETLLLKKLKNETITTQETKEFLTKIFATLSTNLLSIPKKISRDLLTLETVPEVDNLLEKVIREEINLIIHEAKVGIKDE